MLRPLTQMKDGVNLIQNTLKINGFVIAALVRALVVCSFACLLCSAPKMLQLAPCDLHRKALTQVASSARRVDLGATACAPWRPLSPSRYVAMQLMWGILYGLMEATRVDDMCLKVTAWVRDRADGGFRLEAGHFETLTLAFSLASGVLRVWVCAGNWCWVWCQVAPHSVSVRAGE